MDLLEGKKRIEEAKEKERLRKITQLKESGADGAEAPLKTWHNI